ncbi:MAG: alginate lyase family protein [Chloroherpetonaceae bacterium]|nr:alginate lyase family protein [Chloroherpetonaceae bacterium]
MNAQTFYTALKLPCNGSDIKFPWELSRAHFIWTLGKAYWTTNRSAYKEKFIALISDWLAKNPFCYGVNWLSPMDVALRAANWIAGFYFFCHDLQSASFWIRFLKSLFQHGLYLEHNLEYTRRSGNHLLADALGLLMLGFFFKQTAQGQKWLRVAKTILEEEILRQTYTDGLSYEMSLAYHRFVTELLLAAWILASLNHQPFSSSFKARLEKMLEVILHYIKPDCTAPLIGDADDGRLFWFNLESDFNCHTDILATASVVFQRSDFKAGARHFSEHALWLTGIEGWETFQRLPDAPRPTCSKLFAESKLAVLYAPQMHITIDAGELGKRGWGGHGHNDTFSFELFYDTATFITDSGNFCYTSDRALRNQFRSTAAHNTIMLDGVELAEFASDFKVKKDWTKPTVLRWHTSHTCDELEVEHYAYTRLPQPITHRRRFILHKPIPRFEIHDQLFGKGTHQATLFLHFAPEIEVKEMTHGTYHLLHRDSQSALFLTIEGADSIAIEPSDFAPRYGQRLSSLRLRAQKTFSPAAELHTTISAPRHTSLG